MRWVNVKAVHRIILGRWYNTSMRAILPLLAALCLATNGCSTGYNAGTSTEEIVLIDTNREVRMGASIDQQIRRSKEFIVSNDPTLLARLDRLGQQLAAVSDRKEITYHFTLLDWDEVNAFAVPGGYIYVSRKLMELTKDDAELAAVLGHEIGHVVAKHSVKKLQAALGATLFEVLVAASGTRDPNAIRGTQVALDQLFMAYSRQDELQADTLSTRYLQRAGFNPEAAISFLQRLQAYQRKQPLRPYSYARTHPYFDDRIRTVKAAVRGRVDFEDYINMSSEGR